ncbi:mechanosensitive ion channel protein MscS [Sphingorhabdus lutea]|uniref:Small-conductance mechanosensitive channel n=1 Tax=Sphingorhabdus lutea TaxID=1913578 RepID=A0A1L3JEJ6_9SPHN|nr:mechanosensitive ion channel protein MscS [Sphingorhabdus lutea]
MWTDWGHWLAMHWIDVIIAAIIGFAIYTILGLAKRFLIRLFNKRADHNSFFALLSRVVGKTTHWFRIAVAVELVGKPNLPIGVMRIVDMIFLAVLTVQIAIWAREFIIGLIERRASNPDEDNESLMNAMVLIRLAVGAIIFIIAAIVILDNLGVNVTGLIAGLGVGGIAIGLAAQGIFSDLFAAIAMILDKPFKRGDVVRFDATTATVEKIGMKSTRLRAITGEEIIVSNTQLLEKEIANITTNHFRRSTFLMGIIYQTKVEKAAALPGLLQKIVEDEGAQFVRAVFTGFGDSSLDYELLFDVDGHDLSLLFDVRHRIGMKILTMFEQEGYEFAYPTQTTFTSAPDGTMIMPYAEMVKMQPSK